MDDKKHIEILYPAGTITVTTLTTEEETLTFEPDAGHVDMCDKPLGVCSVCADAFGLRVWS